MPITNTLLEISITNLVEISITNLVDAAGVD